MHDAFLFYDPERGKDIRGLLGGLNTSIFNNCCTLQATARYENHNPES